MKLHVGIDLETGEFVAVEVTESEGKGSGDVSQGPTLIESACSNRDLDEVLADRAYDAKGMYQQAQDCGGSFLTKPKENAAKGLHPHRDRNIIQLDRLGEDRWSKATGYGDRSHVEGAFSTFKRVFSPRVRTRRMDSITGELAAKCNIYNLWMEEKSA